MAKPLTLFLRICRIPAFGKSHEFVSRSSWKHPRDPCEPAFAWMCWRGMLKVSATVSESEALNFEKGRHEMLLKLTLSFLVPSAFLSIRLRIPRNILKYMPTTSPDPARRCETFGCSAFLAFGREGTEGTCKRCFCRRIICRTFDHFRCLGFQMPSGSSILNAIHPFIHHPEIGCFFLRSVQAPVFTASQELPSAWAKIAKSKVQRQRPNSGSQARWPGVLERKIHLSHISRNLSFWLIFFVFWDVVDRCFRDFCFKCWIFRTSTKNMRQGSAPTTIGWGKDPAFFSGQVYVQEAGRCHFYLTKWINESKWFMMLFWFCLHLFTISFYLYMYVRYYIWSYIRVLADPAVKGQKLRCRLENCV